MYIRKAMNMRNQAQRKLNSDHDNAVPFEQYKKEKKAVKILISKDKAEYYHN